MSKQNNNLSIDDIPADTDTGGESDVIIDDEAQDTQLSIEEMEAESLNMIEPDEDESTDSDSEGEGDGSTSSEDTDPDGLSEESEKGGEDSPQPDDEEKAIDEEEESDAENEAEDSEDSDEEEEDNEDDSDDAPVEKRLKETQRSFHQSRQELAQVRTEHEEALSALEERQSELEELRGKVSKYEEVQKRIVKLSSDSDGSDDPLSFINNLSISEEAKEFFSELGDEDEVKELITAIRSSAFERTAPDGKPLEEYVQEKVGLAKAENFRAMVHDYEPELDSITASNEWAKFCADRKATIANITKQYDDLDPRGAIKLINNFRSYRDETRSSQRQKAKNLSNGAPVPKGRSVRKAARTSGELTIAEMEAESLDIIEKSMKRHSKHL